MTARMTYDPVANAAYIYLSVARSRVAESFPTDWDEPETAIILELDENRQLLGIEFFGARRLFAPAFLEGLSPP